MMIETIMRQNDVEIYFFFSLAILKYYRSSLKKKNKEGQFRVQEILPVKFFFEFIY